MRRFLEYGLLVAIAVGAVVGVVHGLYSSATRTQRKESAAALKERLTEILGPAEEKEFPLPPPEPATTTPAADDTAARWKKVLPEAAKGIVSHDPDACKELSEAMKWHRELLMKAQKFSDCSEEDLASLRAFVADRRECIREILFLHEERPAEVFEDILDERCPLGKERGSCSYENLLFEVHTLLGASGLLQIRAGQFDQAAREIWAGLLVWRHSALCQRGHLPYPINTAFDELARAARDHEALPWEAFEPLLDELSGGANRDDFAEKVARVVRESEQGLKHYPYSAVDAGPLSKTFMSAYRNVGQPIINRDKTMYATAMTQVIELAPLPFYEAAPALLGVRLRPGGWRPGRDPRDGAFWELSYIVDEVFVDQAWREVQANLARIGLLIERYRAAHGNYPESLAVIAPDLGGELPTDPFSGRPYCYRITEDSRLLLYSVGLNQVDDGGVHGFDMGGVHDFDQTDVVWLGRIEKR